MLPGPAVGWVLGDQWDAGAGEGGNVGVKVEGVGEWSTEEPYAWNAGVENKPEDKEERAHKIPQWMGPGAWICCSKEGTWLEDGYQERNKSW